MIDSKKQLLNAWLAVKANNAVGGIDDMSVQEFALHQDEFLTQIKDKLSQKQFLPQPYLHIKIPKDEKNTRSLGLATVIDKVVQQALFLELENRFENLFLDTSYAYRKGKGPVKALQRVYHYIQQEKTAFLVKCDIDNFFDTISHQRLLNLLKGFIQDTYWLELIIMFCKMGYVNHHNQWKDRDKGVPQGAILSPILSNLYLHALDQKMNAQKICYVRYADDFVILCKSMEESQAVLEDTVLFIQNKLLLQLNKDYHILPIAQGFKFLGVWVNSSGFYLQEEKIVKLQNKIESSIKSSNFPKKYHETIQGIKNYYAKLIPQHYLFILDEFQIDVWQKKLTGQKNIRTKKEIKIILNEIHFITPDFSQNENFHLQKIVNFVFESIHTKAITSAEKAVRKRKREYELKEFENHEIVISGFGKSIGIAKANCTIKQDGKLIQKVPLEKVEHISIQTESCSISSKLITYCAYNKIPIDFTDFSGEPEARLFSANNDTYNLWHLQFLHLFSENAIDLAKSIIIAKIKNQKKLLQYFNKYAKQKELDLPDAFTKSIECMNNCILKTKDIHAENSLEKIRDKLIHLEAQSSLAYWEIIRIMIDEETNFNNRIRKGASDLVNSMLNYGYSILYRHVWTSILQQGLNPSFSYIHTPRKYEGTLIFDFIETFRQPIVDRAIISLINKKTKLSTEKGKLSEDTRKKVIIAVNDRLRRYDTYLGERKTMFNIIKKQTQHFVAHLQDSSIQFKPYQMSKW